MLLFETVSLNSVVWSLVYVSIKVKYSKMIVGYFILLFIFISETEIKAHYLKKFSHFIIC